MNINESKSDKMLNNFQPPPIAWMIYHKTTCAQIVEIRFISHNDSFFYYHHFPKKQNPTWDILKLYHWGRWHPNFPTKEEWCVQSVWYFYDFKKLMCRIIYYNKSQLRSQVCVCVLHLLHYYFDLSQVSGDILQFISVKQHVRTHKQLFKTFACLLNVIAACLYPSVPSIFLCFSHKHS